MVNRSRVLFLSFLLIMVVAAVIVGRQTVDNLSLLQAEGFTITQDFNGVPRLLVDEQRQQIAIVDNTGYQTLNYGQVTQAELAFDGKKQAPVNYRIEIFAAVLPQGKQRVIYENEWRARQEYARFRKLIGLD